MPTRTRPLGKRAQGKALAIVAEWMGRKGWGVPRCRKGLPLALNGYQHADGGSPCTSIVMDPAPTGHDAAYRGEGPELVPDWDWPGEPTPTIILEGGPDDWAIRVSGDPDAVAAFKAAGVFAEPYAGYALCLYRYDDY